ncbi:ABC transporter substrate-binding protein [Bradyrhizobium sp. WYCCWR 13023]|uniref:ABC transporter substrate-binding protein n=1 Tax=Bradyrhizobium zhengyangense TaxID=2911009 RepID=A0A9X1RJJ6_9BRAD|nr:ABC transporter substrate-binding protein [Bradyrhizobium zhengyangense]MCG2632562.1 ABC transporter substrate-binding protein [Bradyrhizobium zhengyangense]
MVDGMERRRFLQLTGGAAMAGPLPAWAEVGANLPVVALIGAGPEQGATARVGSLRDGIKQAGLVEGKDYRLTMRFANGDYARLQEYVKELEGSKPRIFVVLGGGVALVHQLAPNTPIVFTSIAIDPVAIGWAESYAKPGGLITGNVQNALGGWEGVFTKLLGFFKEMVPNLTRLALLELEGNLKLWGDLPQKISEQRGIEISTYPLQTVSDIADAIAAGQRDGVSAFYPSTDARLTPHIPQIVAFLSKTGKPSCGPYPAWARAGLLMSYSTDWEDQARRAGGQVAHILRGAKPGDLPIEQASKFTLVINQKTAKTLGLVVPATLLGLADEVIE